MTKKEVKEVKMTIAALLEKYGITEEVLADVPSLDEMQRQADEEKKLNA